MWPNQAIGQVTLKVRCSWQTAFQLSLLSAFLGIGAAEAQWTTQSPLPTHLDVRGTGVPTAQRVFLATADDSFDDGGALFESQDGGQSWTQRNVPLNLGDPLNGIYFLDSSRGWAFGNQNYRTTDGGTTWQELPFLGSTYFMEFYNPSFGLATGNFGAYVSADGGDSWNPAPDGMVGFDFVDGQLGLGVSPTGIRRTTDGGGSFSLVASGSAEAVTFLSNQVAVAIVDGAFSRSTDGGVNWISGASAEGRTDLTAVNAAVVLAWGRGGSWPEFDDRVLRSGDGGQSWTDLGEILDADPYASGFAFIVPNPSTVVASNGAGDVFHSSDAGQSWSRSFAAVGPRPSFFGRTAPTFADGQTGYFGLGAGFVIKTTDAGATWSQISSGAGESLNDLARLPGGGMIAVGETGTVLTSNGASPWLRHPALSGSPLTAVDAVGELGVVTIDQPGRVYRSSDGGLSWTAAGSTPSGLDAYDLEFSSLLDGWAIGYGFSGAALFRTTNGGDAWSPVGDFQGGYVSIDFEGSRGWAANITGIFQRTTDGGASWIQGQLPGGVSSIADMEFFDPNVGYAVGGFGYAARSSDGGQTWQQLPTPTSNVGFSDLHLLGPNELWVSANGDFAYYSATGGQSWSVLEIGSDGFPAFTAITAIPGGDAWTVGYQGAIQRFAGPPPPPVNQPPVAAFDFDATGLSVAFLDGSTDPDGTIVAWAWDFGDGNGSSEQSPTHLYEAANTYIVRLTVTDDDGDTDQTLRIIAVQPGPGGVWGDFTEVTPLDPLFVTPQDEDFWVITTASADYDRDGDLDVAVFGYYVVYNQSVQDRLVLIRNNGPASPTEWEFDYIDIPLGSLTSGASDLAWGDPDGDGDQDLAVGSDGQTVIYRNDGGTLTLTDTALPGYYEDNDQADFDLRSITWADYDNDGDADLLLPSVYDFDTFSYKTVLLRNDGPNGTGGWSFTGDDSTLAGTAHAQSAWADYDGDEDLDLLLVNLAPLTSNGFIMRYRNDGGGVFVGEEILGDLTVEHGEAQWGDYDADGDLDILVAGNLKEVDDTYTNALRVYRNDADTFVPFEVIDCVPCEGWFDLSAATWADYDSDGDVDILLAGTYNSGSQIEGRAKIYDNVGGAFVDSGNQLPAPRASGTRGGTFTWLDLDGEGDLDYFIAGNYFVPGGGGLVEAQMHVYRNDAEGQNLPPSAPSGLVVNVNHGAGTATFSWNASTDDHTSASELTYDLVLYRGSAGLANARHLPQPGSVSAVSQWVVGDLTAGHYTLTLRAVDSAYNGGPVIRREFNVGNPADAPTELELPRAYAFERKGANPLPESGGFRFALPEPSRVDLSVYDIAGRMVARLANGDYAAGFHEVGWRSTGLASGTYFARFSSPAFTHTERVLILR